MAGQIDLYGRLDGSTLTIQRRLPGPVERVWSYIVDSDLRRQWLAAGDMKLEPEAPFDFVWRNDELSEPGQRPEGFAEVQTLGCRVKEADPPNRLVIAWGNDSEVSFELKAVGQVVVLTLVHRRLPDGMVLAIASGWHMHLDILVARVGGEAPAPFWPGWVRLRRAYETRFDTSGAASTGGGKA